MLVNIKNKKHLLKFLLLVAKNILLIITIIKKLIKTIIELENNLN